MTEYEVVLPDESKEYVTADTVTIDEGVAAFYDRDDSAYRSVELVVAYNNWDTVSNTGG